MGLLWSQKQHDELWCLWKTCGCCSIVECGTTAKTIQQILKPLSVNEQFFFWTLAFYRETVDDVNWPREGCPRSVVHTWQTIHAICEGENRTLYASKNISLLKWTSPSILWVVFCKKTYVSVFKRCLSHLLSGPYTLSLTVQVTLFAGAQN